MNMNLKYILGVVILGAIVGGGILAYQYWWMPKEKIETPEVKPPKAKTPEGVPPAAEEIPVNETADWKTYRNEEFRFELKYPESIRVKFTKEWTTGFVQLFPDGRPPLEILIRPTTASSPEEFIKEPFGPRRQTSLGGKSALLTNDPPQSTRPLELSEALMVTTIHNANALVITYKTTSGNLVNPILSTFRFLK